jgi:hypothetical protein
VVVEMDTIPQVAMLAVLAAAAVMAAARVALVTRRVRLQAKEIMVARVALLGLAQTLVPAVAAARLLSVELATAQIPATEEMEPRHLSLEVL